MTNAEVRPLSQSEKCRTERAGPRKPETAVLSGPKCPGRQLFNSLHYHVTWRVFKLKPSSGSFRRDAKKLLKPFNNPARVQEPSSCGARFPPGLLSDRDRKYTARCCPPATGSDDLMWNNSVSMRIKGAARVKSWNNLPVWKICGMDSCRRTGLSGVLCSLSLLCVLLDLQLDGKTTPLSSSDHLFTFYYVETLLQESASLFFLCLLPRKVSSEVLAGRLA